MSGTRSFMHRLNGASAVVTLGLVAASGPSARASGLSYRAVALTGEQAPGTGAGVNFSAFTTGLNHWIMAPRVDDEGRVAFIAFVTGPGVAQGNQTGIWKEAGGELVLVVRTGDSAPGTQPGVVFAGVPSEYIPDPPDFAAGRVSFQGELAGPGINFGNANGVWRENALGAIELVARQADPAPDLPGTFSMTQAFGALDDTGHTALSGSVNGPGVTTESDEAKWSDCGGEMELLVREGDQATGLPAGVVIGHGIIGTYTFNRMAVSGTGQVALAASLLGAGVDAFDDEALYLQDAQSGLLALVLREGNPAPGMPAGVTIGGNSVVAMFDGLSLNDLGQFAFTCRLGGAIPTTSVMYSTHGGTLAPVLQPGAPLPGSSVPFGLFGPPVLSSTGSIAFRHATGTGHFPPFGIYSDRALPGTIAPVVLPGDEVEVEMGALAIVSSANAIIGFSGSGLIAVDAALDDPEVGWRAGVLMSDLSGDVRAVALSGGPFDVAGDGSDVRQVVRVVGGGLGEDGSVAFRLDFTDGSSGHFVASADCNGNGLFDDVEIASGADTDEDSDGVLDECETSACAADVDGTGDVGFGDLAALLIGWGPCPADPAECPADLDGSNSVGFNDLTLVLTAWGACG